MTGNLELLSTRCMSTLNFNKYMEYICFTPNNIDYLMPICNVNGGCNFETSEAMTAQVILHHKCWVLLRVDNLQILTVPMWRRIRGKQISSSNNKPYLLCPSSQPITLFQLYVCPLVSNQHQEAAAQRK